MIDVLDILVPMDKVSTGLAYGPRSSAFGPVEDRVLWSGELPLAVPGPPEEYHGHVFRHVLSRSATWSVLHCGKFAHESLVTEDGWARYVDALRDVLRAHPMWGVVFEANCDQYPIERTTYLITYVVRRLREYQILQPSSEAWLACALPR